MPTAADRPAFSTSDLCDEHKADAGGALRVLPPVFHDYGGRAAFSGRVRTVRCFEDNSKVREVVQTPGDGCVLVVAAGGSLRRALVGGTLAAAAATNGWAGIVVDGCVRDRAEMAACEIGIRALALLPLATVKHDEGSLDAPVVVQGVTVRPGDRLYADEDGIVLLPPA